MKSRKILFFTGRNCQACTPHRNILKLYSERPPYSMKFDLKICSIDNDKGVDVANAMKPPPRGLPTTCFLIDDTENVKARITGGLYEMEYERRVKAFINGT